ncbi:MAG: TonB-dependent receptor, partial [Muribaculaceae bacterium]|nr:TonB-dependent receptor [Muribaculaceae bacterium]
GRWSTLANAKYAFYRTHYVNNDDRQLQVDNLYRQKEFYLSSANEYRILPPWRVSLSYDFQWNSLATDIRDFARPQRFSNFLAVASSLSLSRIKLQGSMLATFIHDRVEGADNLSNRHVFTPALYASFFPLRDNPELSIRAFYKRSFRMPTFNDLYYADMGNSKLNPERATQYNVGVLYDHMSHSSLLAALRVSADAYYNTVSDKIVAYPKGQQFRWTMLNLGRVHIRGIDVAAAATFNPWDQLMLTLRAQYTFQRAIDVTDPADSYYRNQIPYIPRNSGSVVGSAQWRGWGLNYSWIYVGERYNQQDNIRYNYMQPWYTSDLSLSKDLRIGRVALRVLAEINNLLSQDYDVILNYPMPKRNYRITLTAEI